MLPTLHPRTSGGGKVKKAKEGTWRLEIPAGLAGRYRWAQLDDYMNLRRDKFFWRPHAESAALNSAFRLEVRSRVSAANLPGTWGFGLWNDPFSAGTGLGGTTLRLPALPNTAWFFYAGAGNYLAFDDTHPAQGFLAATFSAPRIPALLLAPGALALPMLAVRPLARLLRRGVSRLVAESGALVPGDPTQWHTYRLDWREAAVSFFVDGIEIWSTPVSPRAPLGLVLWIDNQYAAFPPSGEVHMGMSVNQEVAWMELEGIEVGSEI